MKLTNTLVNQRCALKCTIHNCPAYKAHLCTFRESRIMSHLGTLQSIVVRDYNVTVVESYLTPIFHVDIPLSQSYYIYLHLHRVRIAIITCSCTVQYIGLNQNLYSLLTMSRCFKKHWYQCLCETLLQVKLHIKALHAPQFSFQSRKFLDQQTLRQILAGFICYPYSAVRKLPAYLNLYVYITPQPNPNCQIILSLGSQCLYVIQVSLSAIQFICCIFLLLTLYSLCPRPRLNN